MDVNPIRWKEINENVLSCTDAFARRYDAAPECRFLALEWAVNIVFRFYSTPCPDLRQWRLGCVCRMQRCDSGPLPNPLWDPKKALCIPPPSFLCLAFIHYDASLVGGASPYPVPPLHAPNFLMKLPDTFWRILLLCSGWRRLSDLFISFFLNYYYYWEENSR